MPQTIIMKLPNIEEILSDASTQLLMKADKVSEEYLTSLLEGMRKKLNNKPINSQAY